MDILCEPIAAARASDCTRLIVEHQIQMMHAAPPGRPGYHKGLAVGYLPTGPSFVTVHHPERAKELMDRLIAFVCVPDVPMPNVNDVRFDDLADNVDLPANTAQEMCLWVLGLVVAAQREAHQYNAAGDLRAADNGLGIRDGYLNAAMLWASVASDDRPGAWVGATEALKKGCTHPEHVLMALMDGRGGTGRIGAITRHGEAAILAPILLLGD